MEQVHVVFYKKPSSRPRAKCFLIFYVSSTRLLINWFLIKRTVYIGVIYDGGEGARFREMTHFIHQPPMGSIWLITLFFQC